MRVRAEKNFMSLIQVVKVHEKPARRAQNKSVLWRKADSDVHCACRLVFLGEQRICAGQFHPANSIVGFASYKIAKKSNLISQRLIFYRRNRFTIKAIVGHTRGNILNKRPQLRRKLFLVFCQKVDSVLDLWDAI